MPKLLVLAALSLAPLTAFADDTVDMPTDDTPVTAADEPAADDAQPVTADTQPVRFLLVAGKPLEEPVAWYGPIVMNTEEELRTAFREFEDGSFVKSAR